MSAVDFLRRPESSSSEATNEVVEATSTERKDIAQSGAKSEPQVARMFQAS